MAYRNNKKLKKLPKRMKPTTGRADYHSVNERARENREKAIRKRGASRKTLAAPARPGSGEPRLSGVAEAVRRVGRPGTTAAPVPDRSKRRENQVKPARARPERAAAKGKATAAAVGAKAGRSRDRAKTAAVLRPASRPDTAGKGTRKAAIVGACVLVAIGIAFSPVIDTIRANGRLNVANKELKEQKTVTESLKKEIAEAKTLEYVEAEARRQRKVERGEILYVVSSSENDNSEVEYRVRPLRSMEEARERVVRMLRSRVEGGS